MMGLCRCFHMDPEYLFSNTLEVVNGKPLAHWRWYERNQEQQRYMEESRSLSKIYDTLNNKRYLIGYVQAVIDYIERADDSIEAAQNLVKTLK